MQIENVSTREKILAAATALIADKGFKETTTRDIAAASSVSEMSVFRHFGSKKAILLAIIQHYSFEYPIENGLKEQLTWELEHDILLLAKMQYEFNLKNEKAILIRFKESRKLVEYGIDVKENPTRLKNFLIEYFDEMCRRGKIIKEDNVKLSAKAQAQLLYQQGLSVTDIASQLGTTTQAVNDYLFITVDPALQKAIQSSAQA